MNIFSRLIHLVLLPVLALQATPALADEAASRKARSIEILRSERVKYIDHLPVIETEAESLRRNEEDIVRRTIALVIVAVKGETGDHALAQTLVEQYAAEGYFTPAEQAFMDDPEPSDQDMVQFVWRYEAVHVLLWVLGIYEDLGHPNQITDVPLLATTLRELGPEGLRAKARLRPQSEILDAADLIYRYHWAVVDARVTGGPVPPSLDPGVVYERHYTLNWLIGYSDQDWDDISTDT